MDGIRGYLIKADKSCSHFDSIAALEHIASADTKLVWLSDFARLEPIRSDGRNSHGGNRSRSRQELSPPDELLYHIISHMIDKYVPAVAEKKDLITALEEEALVDPGKDLLERIVYIRDEIIELGFALGPQQLILSQMRSGVCRHIRPFIRPYFRDAENRFRNLIEEQNSYKEVMANTLELYRSAMSSRTNDTMKVLTAMSALFLPLTFLTGLFGMNVHIPLSQNPMAFGWIMFVILSLFLG